jgi:hypothetical protein
MNRKESGIRPGISKRGNCFEVQQMGGALDALRPNYSRDPALTLPTGFRPVTGIEPNGRLLQMGSDSRI